MCGAGRARRGPLNFPILFCFLFPFYFAFLPPFYPPLEPGIEPFPRGEHFGAAEPGEGGGAAGIAPGAIPWIGNVPDVPQ